MKIQPPTQLTRRNLLQCAGLTGASLLLPQSALAAAVRPGPNWGVVSLELDGVTTDVLAAEGGNITAGIVEEAADLLVAKRLGTYRYDDIVLKVPMIPAPTLAAWINDTLAKGDVVLRSGAIVYSDILRSERKRLEFTNGFISEITLPTIDGSAAKGPLAITLRLTPESTRLTGGTGKVTPGASPKSVLSAGNFRFDIQGLESATQFVTKIEGLGIKRISPADAEALPRSKTRQVGMLDAQPFKITLPENQAAPFFNWLESFVLKGTGSRGEDERPGLIEWLSPNLTSVVASAKLQNIGIVSFAPEPYVTGAELMPRVQIGLYYERLSFNWPK